MWSVQRHVVACLAVVGLVAAWLPAASPGVAVAATGDVSITTTDLALYPGMGQSPAASWGVGFLVYEGAHGDLNGDGDTNDDVLQVWDAATGVVTNLAQEGEPRSAGDWGLSFVVEETSEDLNGDGDTDDEVIHVWDVATGTITNLGFEGSLDFRQTADWGFALEVTESRQGSTDLNGDGDTNDDVVHVWEADSGAVTNLGLAGGASFGDFRVGIGVSETDQGGTDLNGDGDTDDRVFHVWDSDTAAVTNLALAVSGYSVSSWGAGISVREFSTDLNGDGDTDDNVLHVWDAASGAITNLGLAGSATSADFGLEIRVSELHQGGTDLNGDGDTVDSVFHVWEIDTGSVTNLGLARATFPHTGLDAISEVGFAFNVSEADHGDLNGDGDTDDAVIHVWDAGTGATTNLSLASPSGFLFHFHGSPWGFNFLVSEAEQGGTDLDGDGSAFSNVIHVWEDTTTAVTNLEVRAGDNNPGAAWGFSFVSGATHTVHVLEINRAPVAEPGEYSTPFGETLIVNGVLDNDSDPDDDPLTSVQVTPTSDGDLTLNSDGSFTYVPDPGFSGPDSFTYVAFDGELESSPTAVTIDVEAPGIVTVGLVDPATGQWHLRAEDGQVTTFFYGDPADYPFMGDWDCDGYDTPGLYRQSDGFVYLRNNNSQGNADIRFFFGDPGDVPLAGDFNDDGCDTLSLYRPSEQRFYIINELGEDDGGLGAADFSFLFGDPGDKPVVGDWDGDGIDEVGLHRESTGLFYWRNTLTTGNVDGQIIFGDPGDRFVAGDWAVVDGVDTPAVFRTSDTTFYFRHTLTQGNADESFVFGESDWLPVAGVFGLG